MDDDELTRDILSMFLEQSQTILRCIRETHACEKRAEAAHLLKGSARAVGAFAVAEAAAAVEQLPRDAQDDVVLDALTALHAAVAEARSAVAARLCGSLHPPS